MEDSNINFIHCEGLDIAASCETECNKETTVYHPSSFLIFVEQGQLHIKLDQQLLTIPSGKFALVRKYTEATYFKSYGENEEAARTYFFALTNEFIRKIIKDISIPTELPPIAQRVVPLEPTIPLNGLMQSIKAYIDNREDLDPEMVELKTKEALMAIIKSDQNLAAVFREYSLAERADMVSFMNYNYLDNTPLETLATQTGRSLSTFNREFKIIFNETPHKWIMKKRLNYAKKQLLQGEHRPSEIYLDIGFENLAHFSRAFKKEFGIPPSRIQAIA